MMDERPEGRSPDNGWRGRPEDTPGLDERTASAYALHDAQETAHNLNVSVLDALAWEGRLTVRTMRPAYVGRTQTPEEQEDSQAADTLGVVDKEA